MKITQNYFNQILKNKFLFENNPKVAVAVSGGPDSMALVFLLKRWIKKNNGMLIALLRHCLLIVYLIANSCTLKHDTIKKKKKHA